MGVLAGVGGSFATADLFNLYVWFEVMLICSVGLFALGGRPTSWMATFKYFVLNLFGTLLLLMAVGMVYAVTGHLNYGAIAQAMPEVPHGVATLVTAGLVLAFLIKAGAFPMFAWLPASYHTLPAPVLALFAGLLTKVGVYAVLRTLGDTIRVVVPVAVRGPGLDCCGHHAAGGARAPPTTGTCDVSWPFTSSARSATSCSGIALASEAGNAATLFYTLHHIVVKANLFLIAAIIWRLTGSYDLRHIGGLYRLRPALGVLFLIPALSLVGIPPLSGFWAKLLVLQEAIAQGRAAWTAVALLVSVLTLYSMMKIWMEAFWKPHPDATWRMPVSTRLLPAWLATIGLAVVTLCIGLYPHWLLDYSIAAAQTLGGR
jgi:multicomponent Na+:H+ antiporter subunit D